MVVFFRIIVLFFTFLFSFLFISGFLTSIGSIELNQVNNKKCSFLKWFDPNTNDREAKLLLKNCSSCHMAYYEEWVSDKHSMTQLNPLFLSVYSGTNLNGKKNIYPGFKLDHPNQNGNCALCHNPEAALDNGFNVDLSSLESRKTNGISCDFCHKIESVDQNPLKEGIRGLNFARAIKDKKIIYNSEDLSGDECTRLKDIRFGPLKNPVQPGKYEELKYNSLYKTSLYCAKCHDGKSGNVQTYSTFTEWLNSPAAKKGVQCQSCHMLPRNKEEKVDFSIVDNENIKHKKRNYKDVHSHKFLTDDPHEFRKKYVDLKIEAEKQGSKDTKKNSLRVKVTVENNNFGHSFPTGSPMRNVILLLEASCNGKSIQQLKGPRLPSYAGSLRDKSGKLFAKILSETNSEYATQHGEGGIKFRKLAGELGIPAQDWWNIYIQSDTRIKANEEDISKYEFLLPDLINENQPILINAKLIWRNTWTGLAKVKGFNLLEDLLVEKELRIKD